MSKSVIKSNEFAVELSSILHGYGMKITDGVSKAVTQAGKFAVKEVRQNSPKRTGKYAKSWKVKKEKTGVGKRNTKVIIHNKDCYQLSHLLENGHAGPHGVGRVEGKPHIEPARDAAEKLLEGLVYQSIEEAADDI